MTPAVRLLGLVLLLGVAGCRSSRAPDWTPLFPRDGIPAGWTVRAWDDVALPGPTNSLWRVKDGVLTSEGARGCWLMWERELRDFDLEFEFKLGPRGNSGLALRAPMRGDPAFDGLELQMADFRYNPEARDSELTGGLYRAVAPAQQVYRPEEWNHYQVSLVGTRLRAVLNGVLIHDADLSAESNHVLRHNGQPAPPIRDRPREGHIGFQELSRDGSHVEIRGARIRIVSPG
ncbi:MAG: DUF1080 domain-containing protein [Verrucomicrobia bacterium]|nr:DUF1080 domain-containing protein [Verrucomicrobiota bacterium]